MSLDKKRPILSEEERLRRALIKKERQRALRNRLIIMQVIVFVLLASVVFSLIFIPGNGDLISLNAHHPSTISADSSVPTVNKIDYTFLIKEIENISSSNAILIELGSGEIMAEKRRTKSSDESRPLEESDILIPSSPPGTS